MQHERGHSHYRWLPQQTSTTSPFIFYSSISSSFLQLRFLSAHPSPIQFTSPILSLLCLEKLALNGWSALAEEIQVQWSSVAFWVPLSNRNTYNSSRLSTHCLWICQSCTGDFICVKLFIKKTNTMWDSGGNCQWLDIFTLFTVFSATLTQPFQIYRYW